MSHKTTFTLHKVRKSCWLEATELRTEKPANIVQPVKPVADWLELGEDWLQLVEDWQELVEEWLPRLEATRYKATEKLGAWR